ncbi:MAG: transposase [Pedobacter sp.]|nr:transposase [Pedobacter sp.]MDQ8053180.1 transposase [Pedobacter sp.]
MKIREEGYYHIFNRGHNKSCIFFETENYLRFLSKFEQYVLPHCEVFAYCLMPNHFHLFLKVIHKSEFDRGIKNFFISYSKSINKAYERVGSLFQGRYKAKEVTDSNYFTRIITYIHQNPKNALLVKNHEDYFFSSYHHYLNATDTTMLTKDPVLAWFGGIEGFIFDHVIDLRSLKTS